MHIAGGNMTLTEALSDFKLFVIGNMRMARPTRRSPRAQPRAPSQTLSLRLLSLSSCGPPSHLPPPAPRCPSLRRTLRWPRAPFTWPSSASTWRWRHGS